MYELMYQLINTELYYVILWLLQSHTKAEVVPVSQNKLYTSMYIHTLQYTYHIKQYNMMINWTSFRYIDWQILHSTQKITVI